MTIDATIAYGSHPDQLADLYLPTTNDPAPLVFVLHGGFWRAAIDRKHARPEAEALAALGYVVASIEYRRVGDGGGWPGTFDDVARALDELPGSVEDARPGRIDEGRIAYVGHSAGGHLALWAALRHHLPCGASWRAETAPRVAGVVALAPAANLIDAYHRGNGQGAVADLLGGGLDELPERYAATDPALLGTTDIPVVVVHGDQDQRLPIEMAREYCAKSGAELVELADIGHFELIDPASAAWPFVVAALRRCLD
ncbi:alpha/beta hydrolase family protein [Nocardia sp. CA-119907]|uniref:alpha/beta hydrolase family protein n=1 Tax=Nocardia sp. CA-119907 TaxID=3239973 RepID=UPI003D96ABCE